MYPGHAQELIWLRQTALQPRLQSLELGFFNETNCVKLDFRSVVTTHPAGLIIGVLRLLALCHRFSLCVRKKSAQ
jgi:hypothetical protein